VLLITGPLKGINDIPTSDAETGNSFKPHKAGNIHTMRFNDAHEDGKTQPCPLIDGFGGEEGGEDASLHLLSIAF
jgi:hypothetical protein